MTRLRVREAESVRCSGWLYLTSTEVGDITNSLALRSSHEKQMSGRNTSSDGATLGSILTEVVTKRLDSGTLD